MLNQPITCAEVEQSMYRAKLKRAVGFDGIPSEVLRNPVYIDLLYKIINFCFEMGLSQANGTQVLSSQFPSQVQVTRMILCVLEVSV